VLRYVTKLNSLVPEDAERRFQICYYLADDTLSIYEMAKKNSGIIEGKFLHRNKYVNKDNNNEKFEASDFVIGGSVNVNAHSFRILDCDEYSKAYVAANTAE
jgi:hypothetical protein